MDINKWKRFKRSGGYRRRVKKSCLEVKLGSGSKCGLVSCLEKSETGNNCDGSVQQGIGLVLSDCEDDFENLDNDENSSSDSRDQNEFDDDKITDLDKNIAMMEDLKQWAIKNNISHSAINELAVIINKRVENALPNDARTLLNTNLKKIHVTTVGDGQYWHNGLIDQLKKNLECVVEVPNIISLNINIDGLPIYNSSKQQFWPILCSIFEIPKLSPLIIGIYVGNGKPSDLDAYFDSMITELKELENGLTFKTRSGTETTITVKIRAFICDSPARALIKGVSNYNSKNGCLKCTTVGEYSHVSRTVMFPESNCPKRNDEDFRAKKYYGHHKQDSPLLKLKIDMIEDFIVADSLHLVDLGLMKRLLIGWRDGNFGKYLTKWCAQDIEKVNTFLSKCKMPTEIHRSVRKIDVLAHWKGSEYRTFFYYLSIVILKHVLKTDPYCHFLHLFCAITICSNVKHFKFLTIAELMLQRFVEQFKMFYGKDYITSNIHNLTHLVDEVKTFGVLQSFNAYPFENKLYALKRMIRHGNKPLQQVARRLNERFEMELKYYKMEDKSLYPFVKKLQRKGGLRRHVLCFESYVLTTESENRWFLSDQDYIVELNSISFKSNDENEEILLNGCRISNTYDVFDKPLKSSFLNIFKCDCNNMNKIEAVYKVTNVKCKLVCVEHDSELFFIPLLHTL